MKFENWFRAKVYTVVPAKNKRNYFQYRAGEVVIDKSVKLCSESAKPSSECRLALRWTVSKACSISGACNWERKLGHYGSS